MLSMIMMYTQNMIKQVLARKMLMKLSGIVLLAVVIFFLHIWKIGEVPAGIANDESAYIYSAYTVWKTGGHDIAGKFLPLSFNLGSSLSPVQVYLSAPFEGLLGVSAFSGRLPYALVSIGSIILLFFIVKRLFKNSTIAYLSALTMSIAPWFFVISRGAWDANFALFFFLFGIYLFVACEKKGNILWSLIPFTLGFYSYHAAKVFLVVFIPFLIILYWNDIQKRRRELVAFIGLTLVIVGSFLVVLKLQQVTRQDVLIWNDMQEFANTVDLDRRHSTGNALVKLIYNNKGLYLLDTVASNYVESLSPELLFTRGEILYVTAYGNFFKGLFYIVDLPFFFYGIYLLVKERKRSRTLVLGGLLLAPIPAAISLPKTFVFHSFMMIPFVGAITATGMSSVVMQVKRIPRRAVRNSAIVVVTVLYAFCIGRFFYQYFQQFGPYGGEYWNSTNGEVSRYLGSQYASVDHIYITSSDRKAMMLQYAIANQLDPVVFQKAWRESGPHQMGKVIFSNDCLHDGKGSPQVFLPSHSVYAIYGQECYKKVIPSKTLNDPMEPLQVIWEVFQKN